jgi:Zn-dependent metalloprotease
MKQKLFFTIIIGLTFSFTMQAQNKNPFNAKKKTTTDNPIAHEGQLHALPVSNSNSPLTTVNYHSIPFSTNSFEKNGNYHGKEFNKKGQLIFIEGKQKSALTFNPDNKKSVEEAAIDYLTDIKEMIGINNPEEEFKAIELHTDMYGFTHIKLQQYYNDIKVYGGQVFVHGKDQQMTKFNGECFTTPKPNGLVPVINAGQAFEIARNNITAPFIEPSAFEKSLVGFEGLVSEFVLYCPDFESGQTHLTWHLTIRPNFLRRFEYFVDALSGEILNHYNHTCSDGPATAQANDLNGVTQTIHTYQLGSNYFLIDASRPMYNGGQSQLPDNPVGAIWTIDANNTSAGDNMNLTHYTSSGNSWNSMPEAVSAHFNAGETYEYFKNTHGRNSINGQGGTIISICNITNENGSSMENAFWNGQAMFYGNGGNIFSPLAGALDVGAHEMGHGVIQNTCNLEYQGESGALNESMADIAGCMVDRDDWFLGEDVIINTTYYPTGHLREMSNPHNGGTSLNDACYQPAHVNEQYHGNEDNGGVHINSGIMNFAYYKFATEIGKDKAEEIYYKSMTDYLVKSSQFVDARVAFVQASTDIYGASSAETNAVKDAFAAVGIGEGGGGTPPGQNDLPTNPGADFILSVDVNDSDPNTLYISNTDGTGFIPISTTQLKQKPSIVDNGSVAVFVTPQNQIKGIGLSSPYDEFLIDSEYSDYDNIAVSKDGSKLAIVTTSIDSAIWVYDYGLGQWAKFHLYNPTFTPGVVTENVLYADAIEWDYTGQYLIYDAYNKMQNSSGDDIDYWDMGIIRVWDNVTNNWGDGKIEKVFSNLPEGVSVGNPCLSKNSPYILAFDYLDNNTGEINVMAANLETGDVGVIFENVVLGYPNYSKNDDKIIFNAHDNLGGEVVAEIGLQSNKIQPTGDASLLIDYAKWGVWYATGDRNLIGVREHKAIDLFTLYPNPSENSLNILFSGNTDNNSLLTVHNTLGQIVMEKNLLENEMLFQIDISNLPKGNYFIRWIGDKQSLTKKFIKM